MLHHGQRCLANGVPSAKQHSRLALVLLAVSILVCCRPAGNAHETLSAGGANSAGTNGGSRITPSDRVSGRSVLSDSNLVEKRESVYNNIYVYRTGAILSMTFGYNRNFYTESQYNSSDERDLPVPYTQVMSVSLLYAKNVNSILEIGSGGGRVAWYLHRYLPDARVTTVELDPAVVELAHKYFGIREEPNFQEVTRDGRIFLASSKERYDIILIDAYRGPFIPFHLLTKEFYRIVREHLAAGGVLAQNVEPTTMLFDADVNTLHGVFSQIEFYDASGNDQGGNVVLIAYAGDAVSSDDLKRVADEREFRYKLRYDLRAMLVHRFLLKPVLMGSKITYDVIDQTGRSTAGIDENAKVLTDDFAPVDSLKAIENHNRKWESTH